MLTLLRWLSGAAFGAAGSRDPQLQLLNIANGPCIRKQGATDQASRMVLPYTGVSGGD